MTHPYRVNGAFEYRTSVQYRLSAVPEMSEWGMKKTDLVLVTPIGGYCVGPDGNVWWVPFGSAQVVADDLPARCEIPGLSDKVHFDTDKNCSYLQWDLARNAREEDFAQFALEVPFEVEYAGMAAAYALSYLVEESLDVVNRGLFGAIALERLNEVRRFALWLLCPIDWDAVGGAYA